MLEASRPKLDEAALADAALRAGSDLEGLTNLADTAVASGNDRLLNVTSYLLARALFDVKALPSDITKVILDFADAVAASALPLVLGNLSSALATACVLGELDHVTSSARPGVGRVARGCLESGSGPDEFCGLDLLHHITAQRLAPALLGEADITAIRAWLDRDGRDTDDLLGGETVREVRESLDSQVT